MTETKTNNCEPKVTNGLEGKTLVCAICCRPLGDRYRIFCHTYICLESRCATEANRWFAIHTARAHPVSSTHKFY